MDAVSTPSAGLGSQIPVPPAPLVPNIVGVVMAPLAAGSPTSTAKLSPAAIRSRVATDCTPVVVTVVRAPLETAV